MKKLGLGIIIMLILSLSLAACGSADLDSPPSGVSDAAKSSPAPSNQPVQIMYYEGIDVNPQKIVLGYNVDEDADFANEIYEIIDFENRIVCDGPSTAMVSIRLKFSGPNGELTIELDPNDLAWELSGITPVEYFALPEGSYNKISALLTAYTEEHFIPDVSTETLSEMVQICERLTFYGEDSEFKVDAEVMTDLENQLKLEGWSEFSPPDGEHTGRRFSIADESYTYSVNFLIDMRQVGVSKQGVFVWYELTQEEADSIWLWYGDMFAEYGG